MIWYNWDLTFNLSIIMYPFLSENKLSLEISISLFLFLYFDILDATLLETDLLLSQAQGRCARVVHWCKIQSSPPAVALYGFSVKQRNWQHAHLWCARSFSVLVTGYTYLHSRVGHDATLPFSICCVRAGVLNQAGPLSKHSFDGKRWPSRHPKRWEKCSVFSLTRSLHASS